MAKTSTTSKIRQVLEILEKSVDKQKVKSKKIQKQPARRKR